MTYPVLQNLTGPLSTLGQRANIYLFGDSFSAGADLNSDPNNIYANIFGNVWTFAQIYSGQRILRVPNTNNFGVGGNTTVMMLARISTLVAALTVKPGIVIFPGGTNDIDSAVAPLPSSLVSIGNLRAMYAAILATGSSIVRISVLPRTSPAAFTTNGIKRVLAINEADRRFAEANPGFFFIDLDPVCTDATQAAYTIVSGILGSDGVHPATIGCSVIGKQISNLFTALYPTWKYAIRTNSDLYDATDNPYGSLLPNPCLKGTTGSLTGGATGTGGVASTSTVDATNAAGAGVAASVTTAADGRPNQVITISGSTNGSPASAWADFTQFVASPSTLLVAGDVVEAEVEVLLSSHTNIAGIDLILQTHEGIFSTVHSSQPQPIAQPLPTDGYGSVPVILKTPRRTLGATPSTMNIYVRIEFIQGTVAVAGVVNIASATIRKVL